VSRKLPGSGWVIGKAPVDSVEFTVMDGKVLMRVKDLKEIARRVKDMNWEDSLAFDFWRKNETKDEDE